MKNISLFQSKEDAESYIIDCVTDVWPSLTVSKKQIKFNDDDLFNSIGEAMVYLSNLKVKPHFGAIVAYKANGNKTKYAAKAWVPESDSQEISKAISKKAS